MATRIVLYAPLGHLRETLRSRICVEPDLVLVAEARDEVELLLDCPTADLVVVAAQRGHGTSGTVERVLDLNPDICVLAVEGVTGRMWTHQYERTRHEFPAGRLADLPDIIRAAIARKGSP